MMNANQLPGCVVSDQLLAQIDRERADQDKGLGARLLRAAKMYAFMKGMGFDGVHLGGHNISYEQVRLVIEKGRSWYRIGSRSSPNLIFPNRMDSIIMNLTLPPASIPRSRSTVPLCRRTIR